MERPPLAPRQLPIPGRAARGLGTEALVRTELPAPGTTLPLVFRAVTPGVDATAWAGANREQVQAAIDRHGGVLLRGFGVGGAEELERFTSAVSGGALPYRERSSPRTQVAGRVYTSTDHPPDQPIFPHNEQSYNLTFPLKILFLCVTPAEEGGATPVADVREVYRLLDPELRRPFEEKGYMYVRNFGTGLGLSWRDAFQTDDPVEVEAYCRENRIDFEWRGPERLRTRQVRPAAALHPRTGEPVWFNHATFFHASTLDPRTRDVLLAALPEDELPNHTFYGDGSPIPPEVTDALRDAYARATVRFGWEAGDLLVLDNMLAAHARDPFRGPRRVLTAMADPCHWDGVAPVASPARA
ncbi:MAG TPA: TauD/TfdA family dioxygenase [Longimicrobium sp.]|nr:TauD/TfdA family dioxygenase [Longimicrobium sp.]